jgi:DNA-binding XRE family transcriptional regulator
MKYYLIAYNNGGFVVETARTEYIFDNEKEGIKELKDFRFEKGDSVKTVVLYGYDEETETGIAIASLEKAETTFGKLLKEKRQKAEMTQQEVADKIGVPLVTYQRWELDIHYPESYNLLALINLFKLEDYDMQKTRHKFTKLHVI